MRSRFVLALGLTFFLLGLLDVAIKVERIEASGTIYLRANGAVEGTDKIATVDNVTYTFVGNINDSIVIERSNIIVNGNGHTLQGSGSGNAFYWHVINNVTVRSIDIRDFACGVYLASASLSTVSGNTITNSQIGVRLDGGANNTISENTITNSQTGVSLRYGSNDQTFFGNTITNSSNYAIYSDGCSTNTFSANTIRESGTGVSLEYGSSNNYLSENTITNSQTGVFLYYLSNNNTVSGNTITNSATCGVSLRSSNNVVSGNTIANSHFGVYLDSGGNEIYHNNFINYTSPASAMASARWDDGYPSGGNYWSDYLTRYPDAAENDSSAIWGTSYVIDVNNTDRYPLMGTFSDFKVTAEYHVQIICNSSISDFQFNGTAILFDVTGVEGTTGFCRICIPKSLLNATYRVFVNGTEVTSNLLPFSNSTHSYLYFNYTHSTQEIIIIPEFPCSFILPLCILGILLAVIVFKRKHDYCRG
jgi:parallel beta-helix repeat protein